MIMIMMKIFALWLLISFSFRLKKCSGLQVIHNDPNFHLFNSTTPYSSNEYKININVNSIYNNEDEDDDIEFSNENNLRQLTTTTNSIRTKPSILKIYSENITVRVGQAAILNCGPLINQISQEEYFKIKSIIWTQELTSPRLLANNGDLFVKNERISLIKSSLTLSEKFKTKYLPTIFNKPKYFDIKICPARVVDTGWYSCYIVKKSMFYQNIKYYTYLNVIDDSNSGYNNYDDNNDENQSMDTCYQTNDDTPSQESTLNNLKSVIYEMIATRATVISNEITTQENNIKLKTTLDYPKSFKQNKNLTEDDINTNLTIKRELYNQNYEIIDPEINSNNNKELINEIKKNIYSMMTTTMTTSNHHQLSKNMPTKLNKSHNMKEELKVHPKYLNITEYNSYQFDCTYTGPHYLSIKLTWLKDNLYLDKKDSRIFTLDFKQNFTRISILKFVYTLNMDTGNYKCVASRKNLNDSFYLNVHSSRSSFKSRLDGIFKFPFGGVNNKACKQLSASTFTLWCFIFVKYLFCF